MTMHSSPSQALRGEIRIPGDKSISHRALMLSSQALGRTRIHGLLEGEDVLRTAQALRALGVSIEQKENGIWEVHGVGIGGLGETPQVLDMGNSGTSARLLMGLVTPYPFTTFFSGDASLSRRPMARVAEPLSRIGARIVAREGMRLPLALTGTPRPMPITYMLPMASAQVKSAILLAALNTPGVTTVIEPEATRDHTENMLGFFGVQVNRRKEKEGMAISLRGRQDPAPKNRELYVPADPSSAAFPMVAALIVPGSALTMKQIGVNPLRIGLITTLKEMGARISLHNERKIGGEPVADIEVHHSVLHGVTVPASRAPSMIDEYPILAVAASFAKGKTVMKGLAELRVKESDRLQAIIDGLAACGVEAQAEGDTLTVTGTGETPRGGGMIATKLDHRIAMSFLVMGMGARETVSIDDAEAIATSFPGFLGVMNEAGARIAANSKQQAASLVIAIDGPAASGKGTLARRIAEHFGMSYLDTGSLYRAVGLKLVYGNKNVHDVAAAVEAARTIDEDDLANPRLRQERIGKAASIVSAMPEVRQALLEYQRNFARRKGGAVLDGRDIGTVVCPHADFKFFITADLEARAKRRHRELSGEGVEVVYASVLEDLQSRDARDEARTIAPMKPAEDAVVIDTSALDADEVFERVKNKIETQA